MGGLNGPQCEIPRFVGCRTHDTRDSHKMVKTHRHDVMVIRVIGGFFDAKFFKLSTQSD